MGKSEIQNQTMGHRYRMDCLRCNLGNYFRIVLL